MPAKAMRLFVGIPLDTAVVGELAALVKRFQRANDGLRWSSPESWHITLQFLGNTDPQQYECLLQQLRAVRHAPFPITLSGIGFFDRAGVFFADVRPTHALVDLQQQVTAATAVCGFESEARPYQPHITLARNRAQSTGLHDLKTKVDRIPDFSTLTAGEFLLYESHLGPGGSRYEVRARFPLQ